MEEDAYSPDELRKWLRVQEKEVRSAAKRRIAEASSIVKRYSSGELSPEDANRLVDEHEKQWGRIAADPALENEIHVESGLMLPARHTGERTLVHLLHGFNPATDRGDVRGDPVDDIFDALFLPGGVQYKQTFVPVHSFFPGLSIAPVN
jgi:hypothetical protein